MARLSGEELAAWVTASCARSGVPVRVTDQAVLGRVVVLLQGREGRPGSDTPDEIDAVGVNVSAPALVGRGDDDVVEDRFDDCVLPAERQG